ncbi:glycosyltransferase family 2 protein [Solirubrobacter phytolaccae]|uniref:Glycosyltransferase family 2 protein n=1 Tax=Solirubrobacter phytolaccae TaxID=1404360 RepID=A0A9X3N650_9ACTN|nr:glycosyltransferase family 2 protein [Solirubrobacter phytolaccae]MDA0180329.1 glycosyltransferase family 2 protein [Solirubrobacter phytolaccae]
MPIIVVPAFNEEANVPNLLRDLSARRELWEGGLIILVDDGSSDETVATAKAHRGDLPLVVLEQGTNQGPGAAFDAGFRFALGVAQDDDLIITLESDTTSDLDAVEGMMEVAREGADIVLASHHAGGELANVSRHRRFLSKAASSAIRAGAGLNASTVSSFFRVYRADMLRAGYTKHGDNLIRERGFACKAELLIKLSRMGAQVAEVPVTLDWAKREGESKMRVLPTVAGYARLMTRQVASRRGST